MVADVRYALRGFQRSPGFASVAVLSLTLGIGANTAIFSLVNAILLRQLPVREPDRLVIFALNSPEGRFGGSPISQALYRQISAKNTVLEGFAGAVPPPITLAGDGNAERLNGVLVSGNVFETLGLNAALGRVLKPEDDRIPDSPPVCVIGYGLWQRRFGKDPRVIGRKILLNGSPFTVVGVTPKEFIGLSQDSQLDISIPVRVKALGFAATVFDPMAAFNGSARCASICAAVMWPLAGRASGVNLSNLARICCRQPGSQMVFIETIVFPGLTIFPEGLILDQGLL
jgi:MacB-like periplasmic core domain